MQKLQRYSFIASLVLGIFTLVTAFTANADPSARVARLSYMDGTVTFSPAGDDKWVYATLNRPLVTGDRLWADKDSKAELQLGAAVVRVSANTSVNILNIDNKTAQFKLTQGVLNLHVWKVSDDQVYEIDTPNLAFAVHQAGDYRVDVSTDGKTVTVSVREGRGEVYGENTSYWVESQQTCSFSGTTATTHQCSALAQADSFDTWSAGRNHQVTKAKQTRHHVSREMVGAEDLDNYGSWRNIPGYGDVWVPADSRPDWAPYRYGHWAWINPWGWTWIDDAPWGFAPFHYGRWVYYQDHWFWVPGPPEVQPVYAPALVAFVGGNGNLLILSGGGSGIAWFPLGPNDVYVPSYTVTQNYFININTSNTVINNNYVTKVYNNPNIPQVFQNKLLGNAITAVSTKTFVQSQPVAKSVVLIPKNLIAKTPVTSTAAITPVAKSVIGAAKIATSKPSNQILSRPVIAKNTPPPPPVSFATQQSKLAEHPGKPLAPAALAQLKPEKSDASRQITVVTPHQAITPIMPPNKVLSPIKPNLPVPAKPSLPVGPQKPAISNEVPHPPGVLPPSRPTGVKPGIAPKIGPQKPSDGGVPHPPGILPSPQLPSGKKPEIGPRPSPRQPNDGGIPRPSGINPSPQQQVPHRHRDDGFRPSGVGPQSHSITQPIIHHEINPPTHAPIAPKPEPIREMPRPAAPVIQSERRPPPTAPIIVPRPQPRPQPQPQSHPQSPPPPARMEKGSDGKEQKH